MKHLRWEKSGRTYQKLDDKGQPIPNRFVYESWAGQKNIDLGEGQYIPYIWDSEARTIRYTDYVCEFYDWYQVIRENRTKEVLIDDQRFEVQYLQEKQWRVLDFWQTEISADQQDDHCIINKRLFDGEGSELLIKFFFGPFENVKLTFVLNVANAGIYRIRVQNTGVAGEVIEKHAISREGIDLGIARILFGKIGFAWTRNEIDIHAYAAETQAGGKKIDLFLGNFDLPDEGQIIVSPTTFGPVSIAADADDGFEIEGSASEDGWYTSGHWAIDCFWIGCYNTSEKYHPGLRWDNITCSGTAEDGCKIEVYDTQEDTSGTISGCVLYAWDAADPGVFNVSNLPSGVIKTTASVSWNPSNTSSPSWKTSPEIKSIIQELIDSYTYNGSQAMAFPWIGDGSGTAYMSLEDYCASGTNRAKLTIVYTAGNIYELSTTINGQTSTPSINTQISRAISATINAAILTPASELQIARAIAATISASTGTSAIEFLKIIGMAAQIAAITATPAAAVNVVRALLSSIPGQISTPAAELSVQRPLDVQIDAVTAAPAAAMNVARALLALIPGQISTPTADLNVQRSLDAQIDAITVTSDIELLIGNIIELATTIAAQTQTSSASLVLQRFLQAFVNAQSVTPGIDTTVARSLQALINAQSVTSQIDTEIARPLHVAIAGQTAMPDALLNVIRELSAQTQASSNTASIAIQITRALTTQINAGSNLSEALITILRQFSVLVDATTLTSAIDLIMASLGIIADTELISMTVSRESISRTAKRMSVSKTVDRSTASRTADRAAISKTARRTIEKI